MKTKQTLKQWATIRNAPCVLMLCFLVIAATAGPSATVSHAVTPNEVYAQFDLAAKKLDAVLRESGGPPGHGSILAESGLKPMHVYQMAVSCIESLHLYQLKHKMVPVPLVIATPRKYTPGDVSKLAEIIITEINRIARFRGAPLLNPSLGAFTGKTPTHVFSRVVSVYLKITALSGLKQITPNEVFAQMFRAQNDVKSILGNIDPARRYRVDVPQTPPGLTPTDVIKEALKARMSLNEARRHFKLAPIPVPKLMSGAKIRPTDVFIQTQIIIAEINLIKIATGTVSATPLPVPVRGKTPSDAYHQALTVEYLLGQIKMLEETVTAMAAK